MGDYKMRSWKKHGRSGRLWNRLLSRGILKNAFLVVILLGIMGSLGVLGAFAFYSRNLPDPAQLTERKISQTTKIFDRTGTHLLYEVYGDQNRTLVKTQEGFCKDDPSFETDPNGIPLKMLEATITAEDRGFCTHPGYDLKGLARAVLFGGTRGGGSTLTQQLVKNAILSNEKSISRKVKELIVAIELERRYSKDEILQIYFNEIPYGSTYYGIQAASQNFYGKQVKDLTLGEIATLAAIPKAPTTYINNPDMLSARRDWILDGMVDQGFITKDESIVAKAEDNSLNAKVSNIHAPHFVFYVKQQLEDKYGQYAAENGGLKVTTSLDYDLQTIAEEEVTKGVEAKGEKYGFTNGALVSMDPKTGQVLAMVGSKDYFDDAIDGQVNVALRPRQPGSSFKPMVYTSGFEKGYTPNTIMWDVNTSFPNGNDKPYQPFDYDLGERGPLRVRNSLQSSLNLPAIEMTYLVGVSGVLDFAERMGYTTFGDRSRFGLSVGIGAGEVTLLEHADAFATLANEGVRHPAVSILKVEGADGTVLDEWKADPGKNVLDPNVARMTSNVLSDEPAREAVFGPNNLLHLSDRPVAAKTGTTNDFYDAWTMGYTPSIVTGVWVGNNKYVPMRKGSDGSIVAAPIWYGFMSRALAGKPIDYFTAPNIPITGKSVIDGIMPATTVTVDTFSGKLATEYTPASKKEERTYAEYHSILHYVDRANPLGPAPTDPTADPFYAAWEKGIADWIAKRELETGTQIVQASAPTEFDDVHVPANLPVVRLTSPARDAEFDARSIDIATEADAPRGVRRVEFYVDGYFLGADTSYPWQLFATIPNTLSRGYHTLKAVAYDDADNSGSDTVGIKVNSEAAATGFEMIDPKSGQTIERTAETYTIVTSLQDPTQFSNVSVYAQEIGNGNKSLVETKYDPSSPFLTFTWQLPQSGDWALSAVAVPKGGGDHLETSGIIVHVTKPSTVPPPDATIPTTDATAPVVPPAPLPTLDPFATTKP